MTPDQVNPPRHHNSKMYLIDPTPCNMLLIMLQDKEPTYMFQL